MNLVKDNFTKIPNDILNHDNMNAVEKLVMCIILQHDPSFPSYSRLMKLCKASRDTIWKTLRSLEEKRFIKRYKNGRKIYYQNKWIGLPTGLIQTFNQSAHRTDTSPPTGPMDPRSVRQADPIKTPFLINTHLQKCLNFSELEQEIQDKVSQTRKEENGNLEEQGTKAGFEKASRDSQEDGNSG